MAQLVALSRAFLSDREFFIHDGTRLRRFRISAPVQAFFFFLSAVLIGWSAYSATQIFASDPVAKAVVSPYAAQLKKLAAETDRRVQIVERRQLALAAALESEDLDPEALKRLGFYPAVGGNGAVGGPFDSANADPTFKQLFTSWKKLDTLASGAIAIPSEKPLKTAEFTSGFGVRSDPFRHGAAMHPGIDLAAPHGTPVYATADGVVERAGWNSGGYGNLVEIDHGRGIETRYGHMSEILVEAGQHVTRGQQIGRVGSTGRSTGNHLHYEVRIDNSPVNPIPFMRSTDYLMAMKRAGNNGSMDQVALGGPNGGRR
ncbi:MAG TPA: M23 family metallopeptidase [Sphingomicrobium sp.]|nr:M23 family metallopeptidase [Sphingomicrobium sp.]